jgi:spore coat protein JB
LTLKNAYDGNRKVLLELIDQYSFMLDDICLYLDTHPNCPHGLSEYNKYKTLRMEAVEDYTDAYGPLCKYNADVCNDWNYINQPWPWEGGCC